MIRRPPKSNRSDPLLPYTTLFRSEVISTLGGPPRGKQIVAVLSGTANAFLPADLLDVPLSWEGLASVGSGLGSAGFIVIDDTVDIVAVAHGVSRFLAVESCGQCSPCKHDGLTIAATLRSEEHTSELQSLMHTSYAVSC